MTQQKSLKRRVRIRMAKTGERYTSARRQVLAKEPLQSPADDAPLPADVVGDGSPQPAGTASGNALEPPAYSTSTEAMVKATGRTHEAWFDLLDAWGATSHTHTEIAAWLADTHGAPPWWRQSITVDYERARGMRRPHEMADGFSVSVTRTLGVDPATALAAFTDEEIRSRWLAGAPVRPRPTRAKLTARFDWAEPASRILVTVAPKSQDRAAVTVTHERLPDAATAERLKGTWRLRLGELGGLLEHGRDGVPTERSRNR